MTVLSYTRNLIRHKYFVFIEACKLEIPFLGLVHDISKFSPREFFPYAAYNFSNPHSNDASVREAFNIAWNHHQKRNMHHWQRWVLLNDTSKPQIRAQRMPERYIKEMVADWRGAGRAYGNPDTIAWYLNNRANQIMHPDTRERVECLLGIYSWERRPRDE